MRIIGAGMAGLLAAAMLRGETKQVIEANSSAQWRHGKALSRMLSLIL